MSWRHCNRFCAVGLRRQSADGLVARAGDWRWNSRAEIITHKEHEYASENPPPWLDDFVVPGIDILFFVHTINENTFRPAQELPQRE